MTNGVPEATIEEIARFLKSRRNPEPGVVLLSGHRAGALFHNDVFATIKEQVMSINDLSKLLRRDVITLADLNRIREFIHSLDDYPKLDKFAQSYTFLSKHCSESGIQKIYVKTLIPPRYRDEDLLLAELIKAGYFETILSTNIDAVLDDACSNLLNMKEGTNYQMLIWEKNSELVGPKKGGGVPTIVKVFGDFESLQYKTPGEAFDLESNQSRKRFLAGELAKDVIVLGYDPIWDRSIEQAFPTTGGTLWYINEESLPPSMRLAQILRQRGGKYLVGPQGSYYPFLNALTEALKARAVPGSPPIQIQNPARKKAFISYSHDDKDKLERLRIQLSGYLHTQAEKDLLEIWDDTKIQPGIDWDQAIKRAIDEARVAILLVSATFLASSYIRNTEIPAILKAVQAGEMQLFQVILDPCAFPDTELARYQAINSEPLLSMSDYDQRKVWNTLAREVVKALLPGVSSHDAQ